jgi:hypothetical protein
MIEKCQRATKSGRPCQNTLPGPASRACSLHETPEDIAYREGVLVVVDGRLTYRWAGEPLKVGDQVLLPGNWLSEVKYGHGPFPGTVTALGSSYQGELSCVLRKISDDHDACAVQKP